MTIERGERRRTRPERIVVLPKYDVARLVYARGLDCRGESLRQTRQVTECLRGSIGEMQIID